MKVLPIKNFKYNKIELDRKDKLILYYLIKNIRLPLSKIAKLTHLPRDVVNYRFKRFREAQLITASRTAINARKMGFLSFHIFLELADISERNIEHVIEILEKSRYINVIITYSGKWNIELGFFVKDLNQSKVILAEIFSQIDVKDYKILILTSTIKATILPDSYFKDLNLSPYSLEKLKNDISFHKDFLKIQNRSIKLDETDNKLLSLISKDALIKISKLSERLKIAKETAISKVRKLIQNKIILDFRPAINYYTLGFSIQTLLLRLSSTGYKNLKQIESFIKSHENILWATHTIGEYDILIYIITESIPQFHEIVNKFRNKFPTEIREFETLFAYEEYKYLFYPEEI